MTREVDEMAVWICQCLCPARHCILGRAAPADDEQDAEAMVKETLRQTIEDHLDAGFLNPWCAICGARVPTWRYELRRTKFATMDEAKPALRAIEAACLATNAMTGDIPKSRPN